jgi:Peptidase_C39 like family
MRNARSLVIILAAALALTVLISQPIKAAEVILPLVDLEPQYASQLCWAAGDTIAVNSFFTASCQAGGTPGRISQAIDAAYYNLNITSLAGLQGAIASEPVAVANVLTACEANIQICNSASTPILLGLTFQTNSGSSGLSWTAAKQQIDNGHPFLFVWNYPSTGSTSKPIGLHQLVVIGYSDDSGQQLVIWDPWPVPENAPTAVPGCGPVNVGLSAAQLTAGHRKPIDFSVYSDPESDMGVDARHDLDQFNLALAPTVEIPQPPNLHVFNGEQPLPPWRGVHALAQRAAGESFTAALRSTLAEGERLARKEKLVIGVPFPIVGLGLDQLRRVGSDPARLLTHKTSTVLFPLESNGMVVDAFLMLFRDGTWRRGGYANTEITRLLVQARLGYAAAHRLPPKDFFMVSVPGLAAFFAAYGTGRKAVLIPASSDPLIGAVAGSAIPAATELTRLSKTIAQEESGARNRTLPQHR